MTADRLRANVRGACQVLAGPAREHEVVITHGNGPQAGLLALQNLAYQDVAAYSLDILGAETQGMIGYVIQQELSHALSGEREVAAVLTTTEVDEADPAFERPTKLIGPTYSAQDAAEAAAEYRWSIARDGGAFRRVVPSPEPLRIMQAPLVSTLLGNGTLVVCVGGGVPVRTDSKGRQIGMQAVVDKEAASAALAADLGADMLIMLTDGDFVSRDQGTPEQRDILTASSEGLAEIAFAEGSMKPEVDAAVRVARAGGRTLIGPLERLDDLMARRVGTEIRADVPGGVVCVGE
ncbi:carbamate kinase [Streptomyces sp. E-08]|uniref:amino acid kinase family protein n=1 Tax=Streptomyces sp. E-08 TaxID=3404047 RepID=UPI003CEB4823